MAFLNVLKKLASLSKLPYVAAIGSVCAIPMGVQYSKSDMTNNYQAAAFKPINPTCTIPGCLCQYKEIRVLKDGRDEGELWEKSEDEKALYLRLVCPGVQQQHFQITHQGNGYLLMTGEAPNEPGDDDDDDDEDKLMYSGVLRLPPTKYDLDSITSHVEDGVAYVVIPKKY